MDVEIICFKPEAIAPTQGSPFSAGIDLYSPDNGVIPPMSQRLINTHIKLVIPKGVYGRIAARSSLALHNSILVLAGVVDNDYRGEINVLLFNLSQNDFHFKRGDRIAQIIFEKYYQVSLSCKTHGNNCCEHCTRNENGFGSTGK
jgi:dUTP pyrophosphatase